MESDRAQNFNDRLNQWVAGQGFWFQLKYSMSGRGLNGAGAYQLLQLSFRVLIFLLIVCIGGLIYLIRRTEGEGFRKKLEQSLVTGTDSKKAKLEGFQRVQGKLSISRFAAAGEDGAFFTELDARNIGCKMGLLDGIVGTWQTGIVTIGRLDLDLRAGTTSADLAQNLGEVLFKNRPDLKMSGIDSEDVTLSWGYSDITRGLIENSQMKARRIDDGWRFQFKGGRFSQNWLKGLTIDELVVVCRRDGLVFEKALFSKDSGSVDLAGLKITGAERPSINGIMKARHIPLADMLPPSADNFCEGKISGDFRISGSTNDPVGGIAFDGKVQLAEGDELSLRDRVHLLKVLREIDVFNNYRRVTFRTGGFMMRSGGGALEISKLDLKADDLMSLSGRMKVRHPTPDELKLKAAADAQTKPPLFADQDETGTPSEPSANADFTLKRAARESQKKDQADSPTELMDRYNNRQDERKLAGEMADRMADSLQYEGEFEVTLRPDTFDKSDKLLGRFPKDPKTGRIHLTVPLDGQLSVLTLKQAEEIFQLAKPR